MRSRLQIVTGEPLLQVELAEATDRQLLLEIAHRVIGLENVVASLQQAITDLKDAVDGVSTRVLDLISPLRQALTDAQVQVVTLATQHDADVAALTAAINTADDAAAGIESEVAELNQIAAPEPEA